MKTLCSIFALGLLVYCPKEYSLYYCIFCLIVFCFCSIQNIKKDIKEVGYFNFNLLFSLSFFLCSYAYPIFMYPLGIAPTVTSIYTPASSINPCVSLCTIAYLMYSIGYDAILYRSTEISENIINYASRISICYKIIVIGVIFVLVNFFRSSHDVDIEVQDAPFLFILLLIFTTSLLISNTNITEQGSLYNFYHSNRIVLLTTFFIIITYLIIGDRLLIIQLSCIILGVYSIHYKPIRLTTLAGLLLCGSILMVFVSITRTGDAALANGNLSAFIEEGNKTIGDSETTFWSFFSDLTGRFTELSFGYELHESHGNMYPLRIFPLLFNPVPLLPNILSTIIYGLPTGKTGAGALIALNSDTNSGSHCVIDAYLPWGIYGIVITFFLFGLFISYITKHRKDKYSFSVLYVVLLAYSIFIPRSSLFDIYRVAVWTLLVLFVLKKKVHKYK